MCFTATTFGLPVVSPAGGSDDVEYEEDDDEYEDEDYYPPEKVNGDLESRSSKSEKEDKKPSDVKILEVLTTPVPPPLPKEITSTEKTEVVTESATHRLPSSTSRSSKNFNINTSDVSKIYSQNSPTQKQSAAIPYQAIKNHRLVQTQNGKTTTYTAASIPTPAPTGAGSSSKTEKVPEGFKGKVADEKKYQTRFLPSKHQLKEDGKGETIRSDSENKSPDTYVTVTKSVTGSVDNTKTPAEDKQNFASTYYTKSSTCGYFTFSCNIVYGANGRSKICRPKAPSNGKC